MAMTYQAPMVQTPNTGRCRAAAATTARDGSGTIDAAGTSITVAGHLGTLVTAGANGTRVDKIVVTSAQATAAANSAMVARLFITDTAGANPRMLEEKIVTAITASATVIGTRAEFNFSGGLFLLSGQLILCAISVYAGVQDQMDFVTQIAGDY